MNVLIVGGGGREHAIAGHCLKVSKWNSFTALPATAVSPPWPSVSPSPPPTWMEWWPGPRPIPLIL